MDSFLGVLMEETNKENECQIFFLVAYLFVCGVKADMTHGCIDGKFVLVLVLFY